MSNGIGANPLNAISKVYLEQIAEKKDDSYLEPDMKKRQANNEKARKEMEKVPGQKNPHFEEKQQGWDAVNSLAGAYKAVHETELDENRAAARAAGGYKDDSKKQNDPSKAGFTGVGNMSIDQIRKMSARMDKEKTQKEGLDPVGKEDGDVNNDGKKDSTDSYLMKRRKAIGNAIKGKMKKEEVENVEELYKGKHGQTEKQYQDSRSDAGKMVSGDSKMSGSKYAQGRRTGSDAGPQPAGGSKKPASQGKMDSGSRTDLTFRKAALKKKAAAKNEEVVNEEDYDRMKDRRMERGGVGGNQRYNKPISNTPNTFGKKKPKYDGMSAVDKVKASIEKQYGKGAIIDTKKKK